MEEELISNGKCLYCNQTFGQKTIGKHLESHLSNMEKADKNDKTSDYNHVVVEADVMFLHLLVRNDAKMGKIDQYLKNIWLECCGHLSEFGNKQFKVSKNHLVGDIFQPKVKIYHDYDFGDTTRVFLKGLKSYSLNQKKNIILLSRNEPLNFMCAICKIKPAIYLCTSCNWDDYAFFCEKCSEKHKKECEDYSDYSQMPVVNSPRMGVCGYEGGSIDLERDGVYKIE